MLEVACGEVVCMEMVPTPAYKLQTIYKGFQIYKKQQSWMGGGFGCYFSYSYSSSPSPSSFSLIRLGMPVS
jgi:hypothetical protein